MNKRKSKVANDGMILTNGVDFGREVYLADGVDENSWYEITEEEYQNIISEKDKINDI